MLEDASKVSAPQPVSRPRPGTPVSVIVYARNGPEGTVEFTHEWKWADGSPGGGRAEIDIPDKKHGEDPTPIHFKFYDRTEPRRGLQFARDEDGGPMWVRRDRCPPEDVKSEDREIPARDMKPNRTTLTVVNFNDEACVLHYRLRFKARDGGKESYDPEIRNGGNT